MASKSSLPIFVDQPPAFRPVGDDIHITGSVGGVQYHRVVPRGVLTIAVNRALAVLTGPAREGKVVRLRHKPSP